MQNMLSPGPLLNEQGNLCEAGFSYQLVKDYQRSAIKAKKLRIKEWDYYYIGNANYGVAFTIADNSYMSLVSVTVFDFNFARFTSFSSLKFFSKGKLKLPSSSVTGDIKYKDKKVTISFLNSGDRRHIVCNIPKFTKGKSFRCDLYLEQTTKDTMVIATPFSKDAHFYYNQKINLLRCGGYMKINERMYDMNKNTYGVLDWGRGVWTYKNTWYWSSMSGECNGHKYGFNLGYGFGDTSAASENMFYIDDKAFKLEDVKFYIPMDINGNDDYLRPWTIKSKTGDIDIRFEPILDRHSDDNVILIRSNQHQVFGKFSGSVVIDGEKVEFEDILGFAEKVYNRW